MIEYYESNIKKVKEKNPRIRRTAMTTIVVLLLQIILPTLTMINEDLFNVGVMASTTEEYNIGTAQELWDFAAEVNGGNTFSGITVNLTADINLGCDENNQWIPIGYKEDQSVLNSPSIYFAGTFEGNNHYIEGVYIDTEKDVQGLFGLVNGGTVQNLTIKNSQISSSGTDIGGIVGYLRRDTSNVINCVNVAEIIHNDSEDKYETVGGIVGNNYGGNITNCTNQGIVKGYVSQLGGITGYNRGVIENCNNEGIIQNDITKSLYNAAGTGGISGCNAGTIANCNNKVEIDIEGIGKVGGIVGNNFGGTISSCNNKKSIEANGTIGGISGYNWSSGNVENCINEGDLSGRTANIGGIVGAIYKATINSCTNYGDINANMYVLNDVYNGENVGGISGEISYGGNIVQCYNYGNITTNSEVACNMSTGGIVGFCWSIDNDIKIENSKNEGNIKVESVGGDNHNVWNGGIVGRIISTSGESIVSKCNNKGKLLSTVQVL